MEFVFVRNHLPTQRGISARQLMDMSTSELLAIDGNQIAARQYEYRVEGQQHQLVGLWRSTDRECALAITQSTGKAPTVTISPMVAIREQGWQTKRVWPSMLCLQTTGPFMIKIALQRLEVFDEHDPDLADKVYGAWRELVDRYGFDGSHLLCRVTSFSYRRGLKQCPKPGPKQT